MGRPGFSRSTCKYQNSEDRQINIFFVNFSAQNKVRLVKDRRRGRSSTKCIIITLLVLRFRFGEKDRLCFLPCDEIKSLWYYYTTRGVTLQVLCLSSYLTLLVYFLAPRSRCILCASVLRASSMPSPGWPYSHWWLGFDEKGRLSFLLCDETN